MYTHNHMQFLSMLCVFLPVAGMRFENIPLLSTSRVAR